MDQNQSQNTNQGQLQEQKVVNLFANRKSPESRISAEDQSIEASSSSGATDGKKDESISDAIRKNMENAERMKKERLKANQGVLKSYRIKN